MAYQKPASSMPPSPALATEHSAEAIRLAPGQVTALARGDHPAPRAPGRPHAGAARRLTPSRSGRSTGLRRGTLRHASVSCSRSALTLVASNGPAHSRMAGIASAGRLAGLRRADNHDRVPRLRRPAGGRRGSRARSGRPWPRARAAAAGRADAPTRPRSPAQDATRSSRAEPRRRGRPELPRRLAGESARDAGAARLADGATPATDRQARERGRRGAEPGVGEPRVREGSAGSTGGQASGACSDGRSSATRGSGACATGTSCHRPHVSTA